QPRRARRRRAAVHRDEPRAWHHVLVDRPKPAAGDADDVLLLPAVDPAVGLHVPVSRDAGVGAVARIAAAAHALPRARARNTAQGKHLARSVAAGVADRAVHGGGRDGGAAVLSEDAGLRAADFRFDMRRGAAI